MARDPAEWRKYLTEPEQRELAQAEQARDAAAEKLRDLTAALKNRCMKRLQRARQDE